MFKTNNDSVRFNKPLATELQDTGSLVERTILASFRYRLAFSVWAEDDDENGTKEDGDQMLKHNLVPRGCPGGDG